MGKERKKTIFFFFGMCLSLYDYLSKASRYRKGLTYLKKQGNHKSNHSIIHRNQKEHKHKWKGNQ